MKTKRSYLAKWLALALAALLLIACGCFVACAPAEDPDDNGNDPGIVTPGGDDDNTPPVDKNENITSVYGTYTHWLGYDYLNTLFSTQITSYGTDDSNFFENDTLVLFHSDVNRHEGNAYQWEGGDRYILTRQLQVTTCGLSFWQQYVGHFTWDEGTQNITLGEPELFSYQYFFGDASGTVFTDFGASNVYVDTSEEAIAAGTVRVLEDGTYLFAQEELGYAVDHRHASGLYGFNYDHADYHNGADEVAPMDLILDLNTMEFDYPDLDA